MEMQPTPLFQPGSPEASAALQRFKAYAMSHTLLAEVDKQISRAIHEPAGFAFVLFYGPSGVGKTTLIRQLEHRAGVVREPTFSGGMQKRTSSQPPHEGTNCFQWPWETTSTTPSTTCIAV
jgi:ABC-type taurine transport system ATPase subunit